MLPEPTKAPTTCLILPCNTQHCPNLNLLTSDCLALPALCVKLCSVSIIDLTKVLAFILGTSEVMYFKREENKLFQVLFMTEILLQYVQHLVTFLSLQDPSIDDTFVYVLKYTITSTTLKRDHLIISSRHFMG